ncbi:hypothetical protein Ahy_A07g036843 isoform A [Arachis hypogaea]|uniref:Uncharacterized protein n=1 Tax=Arachis hypogaea TaxID=3818 RepID=A0A445CH30_ARAHY|nr:hypothetical protein Ahy_A07g036843 isoform A [Arachis hypogaea]
MVGMSYDFDVALDDFESQVRLVYPRARDGLLDFLVQQKIKYRYVSLCPRCNVVFDAEAAAIFEKERMKKDLAHREEQAHQRQPIRRIEGQSSKVSQPNVVALLSHSQAIGIPESRCSLSVKFIVGTSRTSSKPISYQCGRARAYPRGRGRRNLNQNKKPQSEKGKGETPLTCPKRIPSLAKLEKGKAIAYSSGTDKGKEADLDEEYFKEGDDEMVGTILIIPTEYLGEYEGDLEEDYDIDAEEAFSFIRYEDEPGYFLRLTKNCEGCYLSSEGLTMKLHHPHLNVIPTGWDCPS